MVSIITTLLFLVISTYCWFNLKNQVVYKEYKKDNISVSSEVAFNSLKKIADNELNDLNSYDFSISNTGNELENIKITIVPDLLSKNVSNNYVKYSINNKDIQSLNMDGIIYVANLSQKETKNINLKLWISNTYQGDLNYNGRLIVS